MTNNHVVDGADEVTVELRDGRKFISKDIKSDPKTDLAIVRIQTTESLPFWSSATATRWRSAIACWPSARRSV